MYRARVVSINVDVDGSGEEAERSKRKEKRNSVIPRRLFEAPRRISRQAKFITSGLNEKYFDLKDWRLNIDWYFVECCIYSFPVTEFSDWTPKQRRFAKCFKWFTVWYMIVMGIKFTVLLALDPYHPVPLDYYLGNFLIHLGGPKYIFLIPFIVMSWIAAVYQIQVELYADKYRWRIPLQHLTDAKHVAKLQAVGRLKPENEQSFIRLSFLILTIARICGRFFSGVAILTQAVIMFIFWPSEWIWPWAVIWFPLSTLYPHVTAHVSMAALGMFIVVCNFIFRKLQELDDEVMNIMRRRTLILSRQVKHLLMRWDDYCSFLDEVNTVWCWGIFDIWFAITCMLDLFLFNLIYMPLPTFVFWCQSEIAFICACLVSGNLFICAMVHGRSMKQFPKLNSLYVHFNYIPAELLIKVRNAIERLSDTFVGFSCGDLFEIDYYVYHEVIVSTASNFLLFSDLLSQS